MHWQYGEVLVTTMELQTTSLTIVNSIIYWDEDQRKHQSPASLAFVGEFTGDRWIPHTKGHNAVNVSIWWRHHELQLLNNLLSIEVKRSASHWCLCYWWVRLLTWVMPHEHIWIEIDSPVDIPLSSALMGGCCIRGYPSENHHKLKCQEISFIHNIPF